MSAIPQQLLQLLVCPQCRGPLVENSTSATGARLECAACALGYPVRDGIPIMLRDEAVPLRA
ncbi:MAG: Trm112 family protein [Gemmatimonadetes bacterium]|nr:Trm112 family protein [Gemmatimonadota bacterium]